MIPGASPKSRHKSVIAPVGGWNTRDPVDAMDPRDAVNLINWFPKKGHVEQRNGYASHATGVGAGNVDKLFEYHAGSVRKFIAAGDGTIYDVAAAGAATGLASGYSSDRWEMVCFNGTLLGVNGADTPIEYDGTTVSNSTLSGSGLTPANLDGIEVHKSRVYRWDSSTQDFWYGAVNNIAGTVTKFPLSRVSTFGGNLVTMASWTVDGGAGERALAAFFMSSGTVIVYTGSDPSDASDWALVGIYEIGIPIGKRSVVSIGPDVLVATNADYVSLSEVLKKGELQTDEGTKAAGAISAAHRSYSDNTGWEAIHYPRGNRILFNVPVSTTRYDQHVLNTATQAWCKFEGMPARTWGIYNGELYFGSTDGTVYKADSGDTDDTGSIASDAQQAWNDFRVANRKKMNALRPVIAATGSLSLTLGLGFDYGDVLVSQTATIPAGGTPWDTTAWDSKPWSPENEAKGIWHATVGDGMDVSFRMRATTTGQIVKWYATDYLYEPGIGI